LIASSSSDRLLYSHDDLKAFPGEARRDAGFNSDFVQRGLEPENWKPMKL
jgi:phage-related protein